MLTINHNYQMQKRKKLVLSIIKCKKRKKTLTFSSPDFCPKCVQKMFETCFQSEVEEANLNKVRSKKTQKKYVARQKTKQVEQAVEDQFATGRLIGRLSWQSF